MTLDKTDDEQTFRRVTILEQDHLTGMGGSGFPSKLGPAPIEGPAVERHSLNLLSFLLRNMKEKRLRKNKNKNDMQIAAS